MTDASVPPNDKMLEQEWRSACAEHGVTSCNECRAQGTPQAGDGSSGILSSEASTHPGASPVEGPGIEALLGKAALQWQDLADEFCAFNKYAERGIMHNFAGWLAQRLNGPPTYLGTPTSGAHGERALREFVVYVVQTALDGNECDGGDVQDRAEAAGIIAPHLVSEPCAPGCNCEGFGDFPTTCYRFTEPWRTALAHPPQEG